MLGVLVGFTFQVVYNITMSAGLAPVKGLTLPLMSYGGSSMIATLAGVRPHPQREDATVHELTRRARRQAPASGGPRRTADPAADVRQEFA